MKADSIAKERKRLEGKKVFGGQCRWGVEVQAVGHALETQQEVTSGALAPNGAPESNPRELQIQTGNHPSASGLVDNIEEIKINYPPGHRVIYPRCPAHYWLHESRVLEHRIIGSWWSLNYLCSL